MVFKIIESAIPIIPIPDEFKNEIVTHWTEYFNEG